MRKILTALYICLTAPALAQDAVPSLPAHGSGETMALRSVGGATSESDAALPKLSHYLESAGYTMVPDRSTTPHYLALFQVAFDKGTLTTRQVLEPEYDNTPPQNNTMNNNMGMGADPMMSNNSSMMQEDNTPRLARLAPKTETVRVFRGAFTLDIFDLTKGENNKALQVYHAGFAASGTCPTVPALIEPVLEALFKTFPGGDGKPLSVTMPAKQTC